MDNAYGTRVAEAVRDAFEASGMALNELATRTGIPRNTLRRRLDGHEDFGVGQVARVAAVLDVELAPLLTPEGIAS